MEKLTIEDENPERTAPAAQAAPGSSSAHPSAAPTVTLMTVVLFGADGNLSKKKTYPALFALLRKQLLPADCMIVGYARAPHTTEEFRANFVRRAVYDCAHTTHDRDQFLSRCHYISGQFNDVEHFRALRAFIEEREREQEEEWRATTMQAAATKAAQALLGKRPDSNGMLRQRQTSISPPPWDEPYRAWSHDAMGFGALGGGSPSEASTRGLSSGELSPLMQSTSFDDNTREAPAVTPLMLPVPEDEDDASPSNKAGVDFSKVVFRHVRVYYLAVPPFLYGGICRTLRDAGMHRTSLAKQGGHSAGEDRFVLEKPFGRDLNSYHEARRAPGSRARAPRGRGGVPCCNAECGGAPTASARALPDPLRERVVSDRSLPRQGARHERARATLRQHLLRGAWGARREEAKRTQRRPALTLLSSLVLETKGNLESAAHRQRPDLLRRRNWNRRSRRLLRSVRCVRRDQRAGHRNCLPSERANRGIDAGIIRDVMQVPSRRAHETRLARAKIFVDPAKLVCLARRTI